MPYIDITAMRGEMPGILPHRLPEEVATLAENCEFRYGVVRPVREDRDTGVAFTGNPVSLFRYRDNVWFNWRTPVHVIRSPVAQDPYGRVYWTDGKYPKVTSAAVATRGTGNYPSAAFRLGVPAPAAAECTVVAPESPGSDNPVDDETRFYTETFVTAFGEEGPPGPPSREVTIRHPGSVVVLTMQPPGIQNSNITRRRIYRSLSGTEATDFLLVSELDVGVLSYRDDIAAAALGPVLETWHDTPPPDNMTGLCLMANGIAAGFAGNEVMFSRPWLPYAWPDSYRQSTAEDVVAIAPVGTALVVGTRGEPYLFSGISPATLSGTRLPLMQACVSAQSMVTMDGFVMYAAPGGLVSVDGHGNAVIATEKVITAEQWRARFNPESIRAWQVQGEYCALYQSDGGMAGFVFDPRGMTFRHFSSTFDAAYNDIFRDSLYATRRGVLYKVNGGEGPRAFRWRSKAFLTPAGTSFSCLRIMGEAVSRTGVTVFVDDVPALTIPPGTLSQGVLKLPPVSGEKWQLELSGYGQVDRVTLSTSLSEMPA